MRNIDIDSSALSYRYPLLPHCCDVRLSKIHIQLGHCRLLSFAISTFLRHCQTHLFSTRASAHVVEARRAGCQWYARYRGTYSKPRGRVYNQRERESQQIWISFKAARAYYTCSRTNAPTCLLMSDRQLFDSRRMVPLIWLSSRIRSEFPPISIRSRLTLETHSVYWPMLLIVDVEQNARFSLVTLLSGMMRTSLTEWSRSSIDVRNCLSNVSTIRSFRYVVVGHRSN